MSPPARQLKVFMYAMDGAGHLNACVGMAQALQKRGHRVVFLLNSQFKGQFGKFGFDEVLLERSYPQAEEFEQKPAESTGYEPKKEENPSKAFARMILMMGILGPKTPLEKLQEVDGDDDIIDSNGGFFADLYSSTADFNPQIEKALAREKPDLFIVDHFLIPPAVQKAGIPWLYLYSGNPLAVFNTTELPPFSSGYPVNGDRALWEEFRAALSKKHGFGSEKYQAKLYAEFGYEPTPEDRQLPGESFPHCKYGYIYGYPQELDYHDVANIDTSKFIQVDAFCRETAEPFKLPEKLGYKPGVDKLIYFSLGSMGSADVELVKKICAVLLKTPYKCIVSKGPLGDEYELPDNCWGEDFLPQTKILPLVDLVITHGGNNTVTETFSFGKPMIVLPLFGDQYDNAQRIHEKGYGIRIEPYTFQEAELLDALKKLLNDQPLQQRLQTAAKRIEVSNSKLRACEKIEQLVQKYRV